MRTERTDSSQLTRICMIIAAITVVVGMTIAVLPAGAAVSAINGRIAFTRRDPRGNEMIYTANPDGSDERLLFPVGGEQPRWSPDGSVIDVRRPTTSPRQPSSTPTLGASAICRSRSRLHLHADYDAGGMRQHGLQLPNGVVPGWLAARLRRHQRRGSESQRHLHGALLRRRRPDTDQVLSARVWGPGGLLSRREAARLPRL